MTILIVLFLLFLLLGIFANMGANCKRSTETSHCSAFGPDTFLAPNGNCYKCPPGFQKIYNSDSTIAIGQPICNKISQSPMNALGKTVSPPYITTSQKLPDYASATIVSKNISKADSLGTYIECPIGASKDPQSSICYKCPAGFARTLSPISSESACKKPCPEGTLEGNLAQTESMANCYRCPDGYERTTEPITSDKACTIKCSTNGFRMNNKCYQCPDGYSRNPSGLTYDDACYKSCGANIFEDKNTQTCYQCPEGYDKNLNITPVSMNACIKTELQPAILVSVPDSTGKMVSATIIQPLSESFVGKIEKEKVVALNEADQSLLRIDQNLESEVNQALGSDLLAGFKKHV